jgi:hypothetical protein
MNIALFTRLTVFSFTKIISFYTIIFNIKIGKIGKKYRFYKEKINDSQTVRYLNRAVFLFSL